MQTHCLNKYGNIIIFYYRLVLLYTNKILLRECDFFFRTSDYSKTILVKFAILAWHEKNIISSE